MAAGWDLLRATSSKLAASALNDVAAAWGPITRRRLLRTFAVYSTLYVIGWLLFLNAPDARWAAFAFGIIAPGGGALMWDIGVAGTVALLLVYLGLFGMALVGWLATGNVLLPPAIWIALSASAAAPEIFGFQFQSGIPCREELNSI